MFATGSRMLFVRFAWIFVFALTWRAGSASFSQVAVTDLQQELAKERNVYQTKLRKLTQECSKKSLTDALPTLEKFVVVYATDRQTIFPLEAAELQMPSGEDQYLQLYLALQSLNSETAVVRFELAEALAKAKSPALAYQLLHEVLAFNPDHERARRLIG